MEYPGPDRRSADSMQLQMAATLGSIETSIKDLRREILGNGQPGRLQLLEGEIAGVKKRVTGHDKLIWTGAGAVTVGWHFMRAILSKLGINIG